MITLTTKEECQNLYVVTKSNALSAFHLFPEMDIETGDSIFILSSDDIYEEHGIKAVVCGDLRDDVLTILYSSGDCVDELTHGLKEMYSKVQTKIEEIYND